MTDPKNVPSAKLLEHGEQVFIVAGDSLSDSGHKLPMGVLVHIPIGGAFKARIDKDGIFDFVPNTSGVHFTLMQLHDCVRENPNALAHMKVIDLRYRDKTLIPGEVAVGRTAEDGISIKLNPNSNAALFPSISSFAEQNAAGRIKTFAPENQATDPKTLWRLNGMI